MSAHSTNGIWPTWSRREEIAERIGADTSLRRAAPNYAGEVATRYVFADGEGEIGIIASVSAPFCGSCTRARLTTDGRLLTCLFAATGTDLRGPMRDGASDAELRDLITGVWAQRSDRYSEERAARIDESGAVRSGRKLEMYQLGGSLFRSRDGATGDARYPLSLRKRARCKRHLSHPLRHRRCVARRRSRPESGFAARRLHGLVCGFHGGVGRSVRSSPARSSGSAAAGITTIE